LVITPSEYLIAHQYRTLQEPAEAERNRLNEDLQNSRERPRQLTRQVLLAHEEERKRVLRDLHDEMGQTLAVLKIGLRLLERDVPLDPDALRARLSEACWPTRPSPGCGRSPATCGP
jgi:signal transduction histidine kinase